MKIVIIGAGIAGLIAAGAFSKNPDNEIWIIDPKGASLLSDHKAVMRLRDDRIKDYLSCKLEKVTVQKAVYHDGKLYNEPNILLNNLYSLKTYSSLGDRSLSSLGRVERYLIKNIDGQQIDKFIRKTKVVTIFDYIKNAKIVFTKQDNSLIEYEYDYCISTVPMPLMLQLIPSDGKFDYTKNISFEYSKICVLTAELMFDSNVHQTVYFTHKSPNVPYRATIEGKKFIVESISPISRVGMYECVAAFGIDHTALQNVEEHEQSMGKIMPIDDDTRRKIMIDLTHNYSIYSFGRFATWRPLRIDQIIDDIEKIKMLIRISNKGYYE